MISNNIQGVSAITGIIGKRCTIKVNEMYPNITKSSPYKDTGYQKFRDFYIFYGSWELFFLLYLFVGQFYSNFGKEDNV